MAVHVSVGGWWLRRHPVHRDVVAGTGKDRANRHRRAPEVEHLTAIVGHPEQAPADILPELGVDDLAGETTEGDWSGTFENNSRSCLCDARDGDATQGTGYRRARRRAYAIESEGSIVSTLVTTNPDSV